MNIFGGDDRTKLSRVLVPVLKYISLIFPTLARSMSAELRYSCIRIYVSLCRVKMLRGIHRR